MGKVNSEHYWLFNQVVQPTSFGSCLNASKAESMPTIDIFQRMHLLYLIYYKMVEAFNHIILIGSVFINLHNYYIMIFCILLFAIVYVVFCRLELCLKLHLSSTLRQPLSCPQRILVKHKSRAISLRSISFCLSRVTDLGFFREIQAF